jgi:hypothetical protein
MSRASYNRAAMSEDTQSTEVIVDRPGAKSMDEMSMSELRYKQAIVPGGIPVVPKWILKLLHLA